MLTASGTEGKKPGEWGLFRVSPRTPTALCLAVVRDGDGCVRTMGPLTLHSACVLEDTRTFQPRGWAHPVLLGDKLPPSTQSSTSGDRLPTPRPNLDAKQGGRTRFGTHPPQFVPGPGTRREDTSPEVPRRGGPTRPTPVCPSRPRTGFRTDAQGTLGRILVVTTEGKGTSGEGGRGRKGRSGSRGRAGHRI